MRRPTRNPGRGSAVLLAAIGIHGRAGEPSVRAATVVARDVAKYAAAAGFRIKLAFNPSDVHAYRTRQRCDR
ncbi:hypothetical protein CRM90_05115 [Mycobacterium sp. ENV421]|nr:hypothetical protein CRM90_05115 [Mycobacterium sp. ENV421]